MGHHAGVAELADALDLGSSVIDVGVQVLFPAPYINAGVTILVYGSLCVFLFNKKLYN